MTHSFVVLAHGESPYISSCLDSLCLQSYPSQILISTSTPSQYVSDIANQYKVKLLINTKRSGIAGDWNFALKNAQADVVTLAHQDDVYLPDYSQEVMRRLMQKLTASLAFTDYVEIDAKGEERIRNLTLTVKDILRAVAYGFSNSISSKWQKDNLLRFGNSIPCPSVSLNLRRIGNFKFSSDYKINMDWDAWERLARNPGSFEIIKKRLVKHRIHQESATSSGLQSKSRQQEDRVLFNRFWPKPIAVLLASFYTMSYNSNQI